MNSMIKAAEKMIRDMMEYREPTRRPAYQAADQMMRVHSHMVSI